MNEEVKSITFETIVNLVGKSDPTILDIGANNGNTSATFLRNFPQAKLFAFEPDPRAIEKWKARMAGTSATLVEAAVGDFNGAATFHMSDSKSPDAVRTHDKSGSLLAPTGHLKKYSGVVFKRQVDVEVIRLDDWAAANGIGEVDFIWADVQGAEAKLIGGALETLRKARYFYTEFSDFELYEGQPKLEEIKAMLPFMALKEVYKDDALFERVEAPGETAPTPSPRKSKRAGAKAAAS